MAVSFVKRLPEEHLLEQSCGGSNFLLAIGVEPQQLELTTDHFRDLVTIRSSAGSAANHVGRQGMNFHALLVGHNVAIGGPRVGSNDDSIFENDAANGSARFGGLGHLHVGLLRQKRIPRTKKEIVDVELFFEKKANLLKLSNWKPVAGISSLIRAAIVAIEPWLQW